MTITELELVMLKMSKFGCTISLSLAKKNFRLNLRSKSLMRGYG